MHTLKTTINHLKNAYNGNDIEWSDTGKAFNSNVECESIAKSILFAFTEDSDDHYESGSGSGSGIDDDDDDDSGSGKTLFAFQIFFNIKLFLIISGLGSYPDEFQPPIVPPSNPIDPGTRHITPEETTNNIDVEHKPTSPDDPDITDHSRESKTSGSSSSSRETSWRTKRLMFTYFLPLVMAWFGGSIGSAVADLL